MYLDSAGGRVVSLVVVFSIIVTALLMVRANVWRSMVCQDHYHREERDDAITGVVCLAVIYVTAIIFIGWVMLWRTGVITGWLAGWRYAWLVVIPAISALMCYVVGSDFKPPTWRMVIAWSLAVLIFYLVIGLSCGWWMIIMIAITAWAYFNNFRSEPSKLVG